MATTSIYTLSLHDALPICLSWVIARDEHDQLVGFVNVAWDGGKHAFVLDVIVDPEHQRRGVGTELVACAAQQAADRKSTRLNSSHMSISYAVFCLKKKKRK